MSQQHCLVSLRVIISHVSSDSSSWLSVPRNPHMTCEKPTQTYIPEKSRTQGMKHLHCPCLHLQTGIYASANAFMSRYQEFLWSLVCRRCSHSCGFPADSRASRDRITSPRQTILCSDHTSPCRNYSCAGVEVLRGCAPPSQRRRTYISTPFLGGMAAGAGFHTRIG